MIQDFALSCFLIFLGHFHPKFFVLRVPLLCFFVVCIVILFIGTLVNPASAILYLTTGERVENEVVRNSVLE